MSKAVEVNFDGIVGPTHCYAGLSVGNLASKAHENQPSNPKQAALEGLAKMKFMADMGIPQAVLPPQLRPDMAALRKMGYTGADADVLAAAGRREPQLLAAVGSASTMWAANAATVSPSSDTADSRVHFTPANLPTQFHRSIEPPMTARILKAIFKNESLFAHHPPLPTCSKFADEGAANHTRLTREYAVRGIEMFVYGRTANGPPTKFPARQTRDASEAIAHRHGLEPADVIYVQQNPIAIDAGAFHNDVVSVGNCNVMLYHASAFVDADAAVSSTKKWFSERAGAELFAIEVTEDQVPLTDAISSYLFNSQLVTIEGGMALVAPTESRQCESSRRFLENLLASDGPIRQVHFVDVRQSMNNGGGPACLRLRVVLTEKELAAVSPGVLWSEKLGNSLKAWIERHYRDRLVPADLADVKLLEEGRTALDELTRILGLGPIYDFQRE